MSLDLPNQERHLGELDSLRGIAAVAVMLFHFHFLWEESPHSKWQESLFIVPPLKFLIAGHAAVVLFFLLSGFVLALPLIRGRQTNYTGYLVKRVCRIYLPYLVALAVSVLGCWRFHRLDAYGFWFHLTWYEAPSWKLVLQHVFFLGDYDSSAYNTAFWSVVQEMRISIIFPFVCAAVLRLSKSAGVVTGVFIGIIAGVLEHFTRIPRELLQTTGYLGIFVLGIEAARSRNEMTAWLRRTSRMTSGVLFLGSLIVFVYAHSLSRMLRAGDTGTDLMTAVAGAGLIFYSFGDSRASTLLTGRVFLFLGRISYSMYLLHGTVLFTLVYCTYGRLPLMALLVPYLLITIGLAIAMYQLVEVPSINLGRAIAERAALRSIPVAGAVWYRVRFAGFSLRGGIRPSDLRQ
jgi:peptidoglycan/LPS O-acetylase OafA/YrhL